MKRRLFVCFLALTMLLSLTACGAASKTAASSANSRPADTVSATEEKGYFDAETNGGYDDEGRDSGGGVLENQKIIYTGDINLETTEFDEAVKALAALAEVKGGYLESSTVGGGSRGYRWADYTVRVPSAQFQGFLDQAGALAHVTWRNTNLENITETYYDTAGRLKTQQIKLERLQKLLAQAENMEDIITIESAISETEWNIEFRRSPEQRYEPGLAFLCERHGGLRCGAGVQLDVADPVGGHHRDGGGHPAEDPAAERNEKTAVQEEKRCKTG